MTVSGSSRRASSGVSTDSDGRSARILVTDGDQRSALAVVRSLGKAGHDVHVGSTSGESLAGVSRYARSDTELPDPLSETDAYRADLRGVVDRLDVDILIPVTDASIPAVLEDDRLDSELIIPLPPLATYQAASDKAHLLDVARGVGLEVPESLFLETAGALDGVRLEALSPPYVLKPARSVAGTAERRIETSVTYAADREELVREVAALPGRTFPLLIQEYIPGKGHGVFLLRWDGETLASFAHRRIREKPPSGGVSVYRESVRAEPELVVASEELLEALDWSGVAMVEYRAADSDGTPYVMEVNGRFWGSLQLAVDAGVDFPALLVEAALGNDPDPVRSYCTGVRSRWCWGDVDHLLARLKGAVASSSGNGGLSDRLAALTNFLVPWRPGDRTEVLRCDDPAPFLRESRRWFGEATRGGR